MSDRKDLDLRYLQALLHLNKGLGHDLRSRLEALNLRIGLIGEVLMRSRPSDVEVWDKLKEHASKASGAYLELRDAVLRILATTSPPERVEKPLDLGQMLRRVEALIAPLLRDQGAGLKVTISPESISLDGSPDAVQRALVVTLVEASLAVAEKETLELRLDLDGVLEVQGPPAHQWLPRVAEIIESIGGGFDSDAESRVAIRLPIQTRIR